MYTATVDDVIRPYQQYPKTIQQAILLAETNPRLRDLTRSMKEVLKALLTRASKTNGMTTIRARIDFVAIQANVSEKTVQRTVAALRIAGWMNQVCEGRSEHGVYTSRKYQFTEALCAIVGLPTKARPAEVLHQQTLMSDGPVYVDLSFKKDHQEILLQKRTNNPEANQITLPETLHQIIELGIKPSGVCKLRGMAHAKGYDLADIFIVAKKRLGEMKATSGRVFRYLSAMIDNPKPTNYAARASQIERSGVIAAIAVQTKNRTREYANRRFASDDSMIVRIFDGIAEVIRDGHPCGVIAGRDMTSVYDQIESGQLKEITA
jgi:hypothetical protein